MARSLAALLAASLLVATAVFTGPLLYRDDPALTVAETEQSYLGNVLLISAPLDDALRWHHRLLKLGDRAYRLDFFGPFGLRRESYRIDLPAGAAYQAGEAGRRFTCEGELHRLKG